MSLNGRRQRTRETKSINTSKRIGRIYRRSTREATDRMCVFPTRLVVQCTTVRSLGYNSLVSVHGHPGPAPALQKGHCRSASVIRVIVGCLAAWIGNRAGASGSLTYHWASIIRRTQNYGVRSGF